MKPVWKELSMAEKIAVIRSVWQDGMSARAIAAHFNGVSRNAVIGVYSRHKEALAGCPLQPSSRSGTGRKQASRSKPVASAPRKHSGARARLKLVEAAPAPMFDRASFGEPQTAGVNLMMLNEPRCKWPINDGGPFLFCGEVTKAGRPYCAFHAAKAAQPRRSETDQKAATTAKEAA